ncbi:MAG TPA: 30S ribosome-binding factor RbfA [Clostridia bacterium]|nr:30S ribosome-binding factor RbfA [Clostridia bacterium]
MSVRYERLNEELKKTISEIVRDLRDPRVTDMVTIMNVEVTNDLKWAKVMVSVYDTSEQARTEAVTALNNANGFVAREIGRRMQIRRLPQLKFVLDSSIEYSVHISKIIAGLHNPENGGTDGGESH